MVGEQDEKQPGGRVQGPVPKHTSTRNIGDDLHPHVLQFLRLAYPDEPNLAVQFRAAGGNARQE